MGFLWIQAEQGVDSDLGVCNYSGQQSALFVPVPGIDAWSYYMSPPPVRGRVGFGG